MKMNALLLAGGSIPDDDPLYAEAQNGRRSLIDLHGKPMAQWVIDALDASDAVNELYVIGLTPQSGLSSKKPMHYLPDSGGLFENIRDGVLRATADDPSQTRVITASSDIPGLRPDMVDWLAAQVELDPSSSIFYNVITQETMETRFPEAGRSFVRFKDISVCGGDVNVIDRAFFSQENLIWKKLTDARKNPLQQVRLLGFYNLILVALHLVTLKDAVKRVCRKLSVEGRALISPFAEMAMDADKPHQLAILRKDLESQL